MVKKDLLDFEFKVTGKETYEYILHAPAKNKFIETQFKKAIVKLNKQKHIDHEPSDSDLEQLKGTKHIVPKYLYQLARLNARSFMTDIKYQVGQDGIKLLEEEIKEMLFFHNGEEWELQIFVKGLFEDLR